MFQTIFSKLFPRKAAPPPSDQVYETALQAVREEMALQLMNARRSVARHSTTKVGRPRKYAFHDLEVGETCRAPRKAKYAVYVWGRSAGRKFKVADRPNGLWITRIA